MTRKNKKKLTSQSKLLITVAIITICLFVMHRFNIFTKSEVTETTKIKFTEVGTENYKEADIEVFKDESGNSYIVLPEKVNGYYAKNYYVQQTVESTSLNELTNNENADTITNTSKEESKENTESLNSNNTNTISETVEKVEANLIKENIENKITEENTVKENLENKTTEENTINENIEKIDKTETNGTEQTALANLEDEKINVANEVVENISKDVENIVNESSTNTINENTVISKNETNIETNTQTNTQINTETNIVVNTISNTVSNETNTVIKENDKLTNSVENATLENTIKNTQNEVDSNEIQKEENTSTGSEKLGLTEETKELAVGERCYLSSEELENENVTIEVKYDTLVIEGTTLYKQELVKDLDASQVKVTGYIIDGYTLNVVEKNVTEIQNSIADVSDFEGAKVLIGHDITITNGTNNYQPKDYYQIVTVTITSSTALEGHIVGNQVGAVHIKETENTINFEKINLSNKDANYVEFLTNEFSTYAIFEYPAIQTDSVTIYDYDSDYNYYMGRNYTDGMVGTNQNKYTDDNLAKVTVNYYSYDYSKTLGSKTDLAISNITWRITNSQTTGGYINHTIAITVQSPNGSYIDPNSSWTMKFNLPDQYFSSARTQTLNSSLVASVSNDTATVTISGNNFSAWTKNSESSYSINLVMAFDDASPITQLSSVSNLSFTAVERILTGYVSNVEDNPTTEENESERQVLFSYVKCVPIVANKISLDLIDNPYMDRPAGFGFNGWTTNESDYTITTHANTRLQNLSVAAEADKEMTINLYADWAEASIVFVDGSAGNNSNDGSFNSPVRNWTGVDYVFDDIGRKTTQTASNRELNIVVLKNGSLENISNNMGIAYTLTSLYDGVDYRSANTYLNLTGDVTISYDLQLDFLNTYGSNNYTSTTSTNTVSRYLIGNGKNLRIGRGMVPINAANARTTFGSVQGGITSGSACYRMVIETGKYANLQTNRSAGSSSITTTATMVLGNDFDRARKINTDLMVYYRCATRSGALTINAFERDLNFEIIVKSGSFGKQYFIDRNDDYAFSGIYLGGHSSGDDQNERIMIVEGGDIANILGGLAIQVEEDYWGNTTEVATNKTYIYVKGGQVQNIVGGAGVSKTRGDRIVQVTDGSVAYSVSGGSNGYTAGDDSASNPSGEVEGNTLVYIGGNAEIGTVAEGSTLYYVESGSVLGAGNGNDDDDVQDTAGKVNSTHVIIDGNAKISGSVYGGGNYGTVGNDDSSEEEEEEEEQEITYTNATLNFEPNSEYLLTNRNSVDNFNTTYSMDYQNGFRRTALSLTNEPAKSQLWFFEESGTADMYYIKNVATGAYLYINLTGSGRNPTRTLTLSETNKSEFSVTVRSSRYIRISNSTTYNNTLVTSYLSYSNNTWRVVGNTTGVNIYLLTYTMPEPPEPENPDTPIDELPSVITIDILGGTIGKDVYAGANQNSINGTVNINMESGTVKGTIYGGSNQQGDVKGCTKINIKGGTVGTEGTSNDVIFSGGKGQNTKILQTATLNVKDEKNNINLYGSLYGGSALGTVNGQSKVIVSDSISDSYKIFINGNVFAGGKGDIQENGTGSNIAANNRSNVTLIIDGGTFPTTKAFGGCNKNGIITGQILVKIGENYTTSLKEVYGGGNKALVTKNTKKVEVNLYENATITNAFNGGNEAGIEGTQSETPRAIYAKGAIVTGSLYGGSNSDGPLTETHVYCTEDAVIGNVYGGGFGEAATVTGNVLTDSTTGKKLPACNVSINSCLIQGSVYGGGNAGQVDGKADVQIASSTIQNSVYGGGKAASVKETEIAINNSAINNNVYGGGEDGAIITDEPAEATTNKYSTDITIDNSQAGNIFGGGKGQTATVNLATSIQATKTDVVKDSEEHGNVYGGGDQGEVGGNTFINITEGSNVQGIVYGGGNKADVIGNTSVTIDESQSGSVYGGGKAGAIKGSGNVGTEENPSATSVSIIGSKIIDDVFGGGDQGEVTGDSYVIVTDAIKEDSSSILSNIGNSVYGGGNAAGVANAVVTISRGSQSKNVYGGGNLGITSGNTKVTINNSTITNNVYGGGSGYTNSTISGEQGKVAGNVNLTIENNSTINNNAFGGGQGNTATVVGQTNVNLTDSKIINDIYGGGDNGPIESSTKVYIISGNIGGSAYAAGNGASAIVKQNSYISAQGNTQITNHLFGGGNAAANGNEGDAVIALVDVSGAVIGGNLYGGANSSVINGQTIVNVGMQAINDYYSAEQTMQKGKIYITGTIFGGGESMDPTKEFNYDTISVTGNTTITVDGKGYETSETDTNTFDFKSSIFGSGNASRSGKNSYINVRNYGKKDGFKRAISLQRATEVSIDNSTIYLDGTTDSTAGEFANVLFTFNQIGHLKIRKGTTLYLENGANLLQAFSSLTGEDIDANGEEDYATVTIQDTVTGEDGKEYKVINGNVLNDDGEIEYYVKAGNIYKVTSDPTDEDEIITKVASIDYASKIEKNADNRIYMYSGRNLNITGDPRNQSLFGDVKGMTFFGIFKNDSIDGVLTQDTLYMGMYDPDYSVGESIEWKERDYTRTYVLGLHQKNPEQDIAIDGFYTVYEDLTFELEPDEELTEDIYDATSYISYITPTPPAADHYMWYAGPDVESYYYTFSLTASKYSTVGTYELSMLEIYYENAVLTFEDLEASLAEGVGLYDKNTIPNINQDQEAANNNLGLVMKTGSSGWSMVGQTEFLSDPITNTNTESNARIASGSTEEYVIENAQTSPIFSFYLYNSNNITVTREIGTFIIDMNLAYWKNALNQANAKIKIEIEINSEVYEGIGYNGAITPGAQYDIFTNITTNVTTESTFSTYFELSEPNIMQIEDIAKFYEESYRTITTGYVLPEDTTITMIDRYDNTKPKYYYYTVTAQDVEDGKSEYELRDFLAIGSSNEPYNEKEERKNYNIKVNGVDYQYENFIFIVNFENAKFTDEADQNGMITQDNCFRIQLKAYDADADITRTILGLLDNQINSIVYGIFDSESTIELGATLNKTRVFLGNPVELKVDTIYNVQTGTNAERIYDTRYFDKKLGIKITLSLKNNSGEYEVVSGANMLGTYFELNNQKYYPRADGTTRIKIADLVSNASSTIKIGTENSTLPTGHYKILIESFGSADGIYYGIEASDSATVNLEIINDYYGLNSVIEEQQVIIDKTTGYTLNKDTGKIAEGENTLNIGLEYVSGLNTPYITISLYRRNYDETKANPYQNTYSKVDLKDYLDGELIVPVEINQEYDEEDEEFVESLKTFSQEYTAFNTEKINEVALEDIPITMNLEYKLKENLKSGTYKIVFKLYDVADGVAYKKLEDESGEITQEEFKTLEYEYIGETFSYIIIK